MKLVQESIQLDLAKQIWHFVVIMKILILLLWMVFTF